MKYLVSVCFISAIILGYIFFAKDQQNFIFSSADKSVSNRGAEVSADASINRKSPPIDDQKVAANGFTSSALGAKLQQEKLLDEQLASAKVNENVKEIVQILKAKGIELPSHLLERMRINSLNEEDLKELMNYVSNALPEGEVDFRKQTLGYGLGFEKLNQLYSDRSKVTGLNYDQELIGNPQIYKDISISELDSLMARGAILPAGAVNHITKYQRSDLLNHLREKGYSSDLNYISPHTHRNAIEEFSEQYALGQLSGASDATKSLGYLDQLIAVGVVPKPNDNTRDALDFAFQHLSSVNAERISLLTKKLMDAGLKIEDSHVELITRFKHEYPNEYEQYMQPIVSSYSKTL